MGQVLSLWYGIKLSPEDLKFLKKNTQCDEIKIKELFKDFKKHSPDGNMNKNQFVKMYVKFCPGKEKQSLEFCKHVFRVFDTDDNGYISFREFLLAINISSYGSPDEKLRMIFNMYDLNGDGFISKFEMRTIVKSIYDMLDQHGGASRCFYAAKEQTNTIFEILDDNQDKKVNKYEFVAGCLRDEGLTRLLTTSTCSLAVPNDHIANISWQQT